MFTVERAATHFRLDEARIAAIPHWQISQVFTAIERAVLVARGREGLERRAQELRQRTR